jgi:hypothetical protein
LKDTQIWPNGEFEKIDNFVENGSSEFESKGVGIQPNIGARPFTFLGEVPDSFVLG